MATTKFQCSDGLLVVGDGYGYWNPSKGDSVPLKPVDGHERMPNLSGEGVAVWLRSSYAFVRAGTVELKVPKHGAAVTQHFTPKPRQGPVYAPAAPHPVRVAAYAFLQRHGLQGEVYRVNGTLKRAYIRIDGVPHVLHTPTGFLRTADEYPQHGQDETPAAAEQRLRETEAVMQRGVPDDALEWFRHLDAALRPAAKRASRYIGARKKRRSPEGQVKALLKSLREDIQAYERASKESLARRAWVIKTLDARSRRVVIGRPQASTGVDPRSLHAYTVVAGEQVACFYASSPLVAEGIMQDRFGFEARLLPGAPCKHDLPWKGDFSAPRRAEGQEVPLRPRRIVESFEDLVRREAMEAGFL